MRIRVDGCAPTLLANGLTAVQGLEDCQTSNWRIFQACLRFASQRLNHPVVVA